MKLKDMSKVELETLSYTDLTYMILKEEKKGMNTPAIFRKICTLLDYSDEQFENKIGDYYTSLTLDKRFILLEDATWDLSEKHSVTLEVDEDEENFDTEEEEVVEEEDNSIEENLDDDTDDDTDDELSDLSVVEDDYDDGDDR